MTVVYGDSLTVTKQPTISSAATAYADGDMVGDIQTLPCGQGADSSFSAGSGRNQAPVLLQDVTIVEQSTQSATFDILFFDSEVTTSADNAAAEISDAQMASSCIGVVTVDTWNTLASNAVGTKANAGLLLKPSTSGTVWAVPVIRTASTFTVASGLVFKYGFSRDA